MRSEQNNSHNDWLSSVLLLLFSTFVVCGLYNCVHMHIYVPNCVLADVDAWSLEVNITYLLPLVSTLFSETGSFSELEAYHFV